MLNRPGKIYLLPTPIGEEDLDQFSQALLTRATSLSHLAVENIRTIRRWLKRIDRTIDIDILTFYELNKRTDDQVIEEMIKVLLTGQDFGIMSEAGCPGIADPGSKLVARAHQNDIEIVPVVGPSSIFLALMASGLNGQKFTFHGYLPIKKEALKSSLKAMISSVEKHFHAHIFIETPYRNEALFDSILSILPDHIYLCVACDLSSPDQLIRTKTIAEWKKMSKPALHKKPVVFVLGKVID